MKIGDRVKFSFAGREIEGTIFKIFPKTLYIKVDFPNHKGKIIKRKVHTVKLS